MLWHEVESDGFPVLPGFDLAHQGIKLLARSDDLAAFGGDPLAGVFAGENHVRRGVNSTTAW